MLGASVAVKRQGKGIKGGRADLKEGTGEVLHGPRGVQLHHRVQGGGEGGPGPTLLPAERVDDVRPPRPVSGVAGCGEGWVCGVHAGVKGAGAPRLGKPPHG